MKEVKISNADRDLRQLWSSRLVFSDLKEWTDDTSSLDYGTIIICREGRCAITVNFSSWTLTEGTVLTLFPKDVVVVRDVSDDFRVEMLVYDSAILREASLNLEHTVYQQLRKDRCRRKSPIVTAIIDNMFALLRVYFEQEECTCVDLLVVQQLKSFFIGFYEYMNRNPAEDTLEGSRRAKEILRDFTILIEQYYKTNRNVAFYADCLHITTKYLNNVTSEVTGYTSKTIIDHFVVLQLKLALRDSSKSIKEISHEYHFNDLSFFSRYFRQHTGMSPKEFRRGR